jgi:hypothetical protein
MEFVVGVTQVDLRIDCRAFYAISKLEMKSRTSANRISHYYNAFV